jgi:membrane associated rhomboid family serine protease
VTAWDPQKPPDRPDAPLGLPEGVTLRCYRHPDQPTRVRCARCGRPICPACMVAAPVGHQCPECVAQARREFRGGVRGRARTVAGVSATKLLLFAIGAVYVLEVVVSHGQALSFGNGIPNKTAYDMGALFPPAIAGLPVHIPGIGGPYTHTQYWRLFTAMFLHANLLHIAFNAWALWLFGNFVEATFGTARMLLIYFVTGLFASATSYMFGPVVQLGLGASGAIVGLLGAFLAYNVRRRHLAVAQGYIRWAIMLIVLNAVFGATFGGIDNWAHGGGLVSGFAAGLAAEGIGSGETRRVSRIIGFLVIIAVGVAMVLLRTHSLQAQVKG